MPRTLVRLSQTTRAAAMRVTRLPAWVDRALLVLLWMLLLLRFIHAQ